MSSVEAAPGTAVPGRRADQVLRALRADIVAGSYPPGSRLTEAALCAAYGVSRVPVREALRQLEVEGFTTSVAYAGARVAQLGAEEAIALSTVRTTVEDLTVRGAAERFRCAPEEPEVRAFGLRLDELVEAGRGGLAGLDLDRLPSLNTAFHSSIAEFCRNPTLLGLFRQIAAKVEWLYAMDVGVRGEHSWAEHAAIAEAVRAGEPDRATSLMRRHVRSSLDGYLRRHST